MIRFVEDILRAFLILPTKGESLLIRTARPIIIFLAVFIGLFSLEDKPRIRFFLNGSIFVLVWVIPFYLWVNKGVRSHSPDQSMFTLSVTSFFKLLIFPFTLLVHLIGYILSLIVTFLTLYIPGLFKTLANRSRKNPLKAMAFFAFFAVVALVVMMAPENAMWVGMWVIVLIVSLKITSLTLLILLGYTAHEIIRSERFKLWKYLLAMFFFYCPSLWFAFQIDGILVNPSRQGHFLSGSLLALASIFFGAAILNNYRKERMTFMDRQTVSGHTAD